MNTAEKIIASLPKKLSGPKAQAALRSAGVPVVMGNDAPRGGRTGEYFEARRNSRAAVALRELLVKEGR